MRALLAAIGCHGVLATLPMVYLTRKRALRRHPFVPAGLGAVAHYAVHVNEAPNHELSAVRWLAIPHCGSLSMTPRALRLFS